MREIVEKVRESCGERGLFETAKWSVPWAFNHGIRPRLPSRLVEFNGVTVRAARWFDGIIPWELPLHPHPDRYEAALATAVRASVEPGDRVVVVGGGWGVTAVVAARQVGDTGDVVVFEGARENASHVEETAELNGKSDLISVRHAVVSRAVRLSGRRGKPSSVDASELPECDVLEMDCEGAEVHILEDLAIRPRVVIVETHTELGAPPERVRKALTDLSYEVVSQEVAEVGEAEEWCRENGVFVLVARRIDS